MIRETPISRWDIKVDAFKVKLSKYCISALKIVLSHKLFCHLLNYAFDLSLWVLVHVERATMAKCGEVKGVSGFKFDISGWLVSPCSKPLNFFLELI